MGETGFPCIRCICHWASSLEHWYRLGHWYCVAPICTENVLTVRYVAGCRTFSA